MINGVVKGKDTLAEDREIVKEIVVVKSHQNRTFQTIRSFILNNQNIFVSKPHCQDCLSDDRDPDQGSMGLDLPKTARQVSLSDDQIALFFSRPTVYIRRCLAYFVFFPVCFLLIAKNWLPQQV